MDFSDDMIDEVLKIFQVESEEIISKLNNNLLDLEKNPNNKDIIILLFRDAHTLKGAARMVGFNNIQTLAHKMEDIIGLAKENKISLNTDVVNTLYKTVDILGELIKKSIEKGQDIYSESIASQISLLENIENNTDITTVQNNMADFNIENFNQCSSKINDLIPECLITLMNMGLEITESLVQQLFSTVHQLYEIFNFTGPFEIKNLLGNIDAKLEFIIKTSSSLTNGEIEEIHKTINEIINTLISICEEHDIEVMDYYGKVFAENQNIESKETKIEVKKEPEIIEEKKELQGKTEYENEPEIRFDLMIIQDKISGLLQNKSSINEIINNLKTFEQNCTDGNVKKVLHKIIEILEYASQKEIKFDEETISSITQSIDYCNNTMKNQSDSSDNELILQRLEIVQQVLSFTEEESKKDDFFAPRPAPKSKNIAEELLNAEEIKTLRIDSSKLDTLINQVNELTITRIKSKKHLNELNTINEQLEEWQKDSIKTLNYLKHYDKKYFQLINQNSSLSHFVKQLINSTEVNNKKIQEVISNIENLNRVVQEDDIKIDVNIDNLSNMVKNVRVLPLSTVFQQFGRMVRDIAQEKNKQIELEIIGSETCTDKKIIEEIKAPLIHIIRNSIDHGIETPEERTALGKRPTGKIILAAKQVSNKVIIEIQDDGRGINLEKIKEKAVQKGFLTQEELNSMTNEQITNIIFAPGFSTGEQITNISGRGIGLDVVQSKISQLNGKVRVISELNKGCCVQIELPTTMAITKVFIVKSSNQTFAIPMDLIKTVLRKKEDELIQCNNGKSIIYGTETIPIHRLSDILNLPAATNKKERETILIIESDNKTIAMIVDKLIDDQEILQKKLSPPFYKLKNISGITTLASGEVCLILNISGILNTLLRTANYLPASKTQAKLESKLFKILLVDDSITTLTLEKNILTKAGYVTETAENPIEAFEKMKSNRFDLIISDVEMPEMNGFEFLEKLKTDEMFFDIPVIIVSSQSLDENKKLASKLGAKKYIVKSEFDQDEFLTLIDEILQNRDLHSV